MEKPHIDIGHIHRLIDGYFEASLSEAEENELRTLLAATECRSPQIDSARAVLGLGAATAACKKAHKIIPRRRSPWLAAASIAAVLILTVAAISLWPTYQTGECIAYVGNNTITDTNTVLAMMHNDLTAFAEASSSVQRDVAAQISELAPELSNFQ